LVSSAFSNTGRSGFGEAPALEQSDGTPELGSPMPTFIDSLSRFLQVASSRQQFIASNIANADTPGFKTQDLDFGKSLQCALSGEGAAPMANEVEGLSARPDGNNVSLERETLALADTEARFRVAAQMLRAQFRQLSTAIQGDR